jgi:hypothetical protein
MSSSPSRSYAGKTLNIDSLNVSLVLDDNGVPWALETRIAGERFRCYFHQVAEIKDAEKINYAPMFKKPPIQVPHER